MKKLLVLAMMATLLTAGSAFAIIKGSVTPIQNATFQFGAPGVAFGPTTTNNDDSCDIGVAPAATLLLPYFEVDFTNRTTNTLFTITNVSRFPQIAHVTVWTDRSYPVLDFNIFLTGYDVQGISMMDILVDGKIASNIGTGPTTAQSPIGSPNLTNSYVNPNFSAAIGCGSNPGILPTGLTAAVRTALTTGAYAPGGAGPSCTGVGNTHANAIGYITIDVAANCSQKLPTDSSYYLTDILFDNVLIGDYQQLGPTAAGVAATSFDGAGNAMVHIRAVPEGGGAGAPANVPGTNLPYTFYDRYTPAAARTQDRRQPLPSTWAARYIQGGTSALATNFKIWREGVTSGAAGCSVAANGVLPISEIVRFDEHENPYVNGGGPNCSPIEACQGSSATLPETSSTNTASTTYPPLGGADVGGWMYMNLNNGGSLVYSVTTSGVPHGAPSNLAPSGGTTSIGPRPSQNWVIVEMFGNVANGAGVSQRLSVDFDAAWLGNGCSPAAFTSTANAAGGVPIGPAGGVFVCPPGTTLTNGTVTLCTGTNTTPIP